MVATKVRQWVDVTEDTPKVKPGAKRILQALSAGKTTGTFKLQGLNLSEIPPLVYNGDPLPEEAGDQTWWQEAPVVGLDASRNRISVLPADLMSLLGLCSIDLSHNEIGSIPEEVGSLTSLQALNISNNILATLPQALAELPHLLRLDCSSNTLTALPRDFGAVCTGLVSLLAAENAIAHVPGGLSACGHLASLVMDGNVIETVPESILVGATSLTELKLSRNKLSGCLPASLSALQKLRDLDVCQNRLTELPRGLGHCTALVELNLAFNRLQALPAEIGLLSALQTLDVRNNLLTEIPGSICDLNLRLLDVTNNNINNLPPRLGEMTSLRALPCTGNPFRGLRQAARGMPFAALMAALRNRITDDDAQEASSSGTPSRGGQAGGWSCEFESIPVRGAAGRGSVPPASPITPGVREVLLARHGLHSVYPEVWENSSVLTRLDLSANMITRIPVDALAACSLLRSLQLADNRLVSEWPLPQAPGSLPNLRTLEMRRNPLALVPAHAFASCQHLHTLDMSGIPAVGQAVPQVWQGLSSLTELRVSACRLIELLDLTHLTALRILDASTNKIAAVPECVTALVKLEELDLTDNNVSALPPTLGFMSQLRALKVGGNPLRSIRRPILEGGTPALLDYLRGRAPVPACR